MLFSQEVQIKRSIFTENLIVAVLKEADAGKSVKEICWQHGISDATYYKWKSKYGGMEASMVSQMKALEEESRGLKKMYAEAQTSADILKEKWPRLFEQLSPIYK